MNIKKSIQLTSLGFLAVIVFASIYALIVISSAIESRDENIRNLEHEIDSLKNEIVFRDMYYDRVRNFVN